MLALNPGHEAKTVFADLQLRFPCQFADDDTSLLLYVTNSL